MRSESYKNFFFCPFLFDALEAKEDEFLNFADDRLCGPGSHVCCVSR